jgi:hypothetical protein
VTVGESTFDIRHRALVAAVVPMPRFGRESEVAAAIRAAGQAGADLVDASLPLRLVGPAARSGAMPVAVRVASGDEAGRARAAGAGLLLVLARDDTAVADVVAAGLPVALLVDEVAAVAAARDLAEGHGMLLAVDVSGRSRDDALALESAAVPLGCRVVCTPDVRRTRRVVEVVAALLAARRTAERDRDPEGDPG